MKNRMDKFIQAKTYIDLESIAASLSSADADEQALFLNTFFDALKVNCEDLYRFNMQLGYILKQSTHNSKLAYEFLGSDND